MGCPAVFSVEIINGSFIDIDTMTCAHVFGYEVVERLEGVRPEFSPVAEGGSSDADPGTALKYLLLSVKWKVVVVFGCEDVG